MKKLLVSSAMLALLASGSSGVMAQAASQQVNITATVPLYCSIGGAASGSALTVVDIPVSTLGVVNASQQTRTALNVTCNQSAYIDLASGSGGVTGPAPPSGAFTNKIHYSATAGVGIGSDGTLNTATPGATQGDTGSAFSGAGLLIAITPIPPTLPLVSGAYSDTLTVTLTPHV